MQNSSELDLISWNKITQMIANLSLLFLCAFAFRFRSQSVNNFNPKSSNRLDLIFSRSNTNLDVCSSLVLFDIYKQYAS